MIMYKDLDNINKNKRKYFNCAKELEIQDNKSNIRQNASKYTKRIVF